MINSSDLNFITDTIRDQLLQVNTCLIAKVVTVNDNGTVDVQPVVKKVFADGTDRFSEDHIILPNIPIINLASGVYRVAFPVAVDQEGVVIFSQRDISKYLILGENVEPTSLRLHAKEDGMFLPTTLVASDRLEQPTDALTLTAGNTSLEIREDGFTFTGDTVFEGNMEVVGDVVVTSGDVTADTGDITATAGTVKSKTIELDTHVHIESDGGTTAPPTP